MDYFQESRHGPIRFFLVVLGRTITLCFDRLRALRAMVRVSRRPAATANAIGSNKKARFRRGAKTLSNELSSVEWESIRKEKAGSTVLALTTSRAPSRARSKSPFSLFSSHHTALTFTPDIKITASDPLTPLSPSVYYALPPTSGSSPPCSVRLGPHGVCPSAPETD